MPAPASRLFYVMGPSGAGKDTLLSAARERLPARDWAFPARYITRTADAGGEAHVAVDTATFDRLRHRGDFLFDWTSHDHAYGVHRAVLDDLAAGRHVAVNGSRAYLAEARRRCPALVPVVIRVTPAVLQQRLEARGREDAAAIAGRLARARTLDAAPPADALVISNDGPRAAAADAFCAALVAATRGHATA